jgi:hypothetical protein
LARFWLRLAPGGFKVLEVAVNGEARLSESGRKNWGQLLDLLESGEGASRSIVTAVRFDGVAVPTFREPSMLGKTLGDVELIEVETSTFDQLLHESALTAYGSVAPLKRAVARIAASFRGRDPDGACRELPSLTAALQGLTVVTAMLTSARRSASDNGRHFDVLASRLCGVLDDIVECQTREDWRGIAAILETSLTTALTDWASVLLALDGDPELPSLPTRQSESCS